MTKCKYIDDYISSIESGDTPASKEMHLACAYIKGKLNNDDVLIDTEKTEKAIELIERYFKMSLFRGKSLLSHSYTAIIVPMKQWCSVNF